MFGKSSVSIAKDRLKALVVSDRVHCTPDTYENVSRELYETLSKYIQITKEDFHVEINRTQVVITIAGEET